MGSKDWENIVIGKICMWPGVLQNSVYICVGTSSQEPSPLKYSVKL